MPLIRPKTLGKKDDFNVGDIVSFKDTSGDFEGKIVRKLTKKAEVTCKDGQTYGLPYAFLTMKSKKEKCTSEEMTYENVTFGRPKELETRRGISWTAKLYYKSKWIATAENDGNGGGTYVSNHYKASQEHRDALDALERKFKKEYPLLDTLNEGFGAIAAHAESGLSIADCIEIANWGDHSIAEQILARRAQNSAK